MGEYAHERIAVTGRPQGVRRYGENDARLYPFEVEYVRADLHRGAVDLLREIVDPQTDPCRYDHHGYCQAHWLHERPCPVERAHDLLGGRT